MGGTVGARSGRTAGSQFGRPARGTEAIFVTRYGDLAIIARNRVSWESPPPMICRP
jgi:hypothetical protein